LERDSHRGRASVSRSGLDRQCRPISLTSAEALGSPTSNPQQPQAIVSADQVAMRSQQNVKDFSMGNIARK
jgi:hypothetical protein